MDEVADRLRSHVAEQQRTVADVLGKFFDPRDGHVTQRLEAFASDHGVLARTLEKFLAPQNSVLAQTLAAQVGETSPLLKRLSPTDSDGVVKAIEAQLRAVLDDAQRQVVKALDPLAEEGAISRPTRSH